MPNSTVLRTMPPDPESRMLKGVLNKLKLDFQLNVWSIGMAVVAVIIFALRGEGQVDLLRLRMDTVETNVGFIRADVAGIARDIKDLQSNAARDEGRRERGQERNGRQ